MWLSWILIRPDQVEIQIDKVSSKSCHKQDVVPALKASRIHTARRREVAVCQSNYYFIINYGMWTKKTTRREEMW